MIVEDFASPVARRRRKSRACSIAARERFIRGCMVAAVSGRVDRLLPVIWEGDVVAWVGARGDLAIMLRHERWMDREVGPGGYLFNLVRIDDLIKFATQNDRFYHAVWFKTLGSGPGTHWAHLFALQGAPCGQWDGTALSNKDRDDTSLGAIFHGGNVSPLTKWLVSGGTKQGESPSVADPTMYVLYDLVRSYDNIVSSGSLQTLTNSPGTPPRYCAAGDIGLDLMSVTIGGSGNQAWSTMSYTDVAGTGSKTPDIVGVQAIFSSGAATPIDQWASAFQYGGGNSILKLGLVNGDTGVRTIDSVTIATGATVGIVLGRQIAWTPNQLSGNYVPIDFAKQAGIIVIRDGACLTHAKFEISLSHTNRGSLNFIWGQA